jgi:hypothetical protein
VTSAAVRRRRALVAVVGVVAVGAAGALAVDALRDGRGLPGADSRCTATAGGASHSFTADRTAVAALVAARAQARGLPPRAATIGIATAIQESGLRNLDHGDRDSLGIFQQRPSQGWGTPEQVTDPVHATDAFYDGLVEVEGYTEIEVNDAAQEVQRSGFPTAYADHEGEARVFASALTGHSPAALVCRLPAVEEAGDGLPPAVGDDGLTPGARAVVERAAAELGEEGLVPRPDAGGATLARDHGADEEGVRAGWALAQWAVATAVGTDVVEVATDGRRWSRDGDAAWVADDAAPGPGAVEVVVAG